MMNDPRPSFSSGESQMGELMCSFDWAATPVGPPHTWPQSLRTAVQIVLGSRYPMFVWWGKALTNFYNDSYAPMLGKRHPNALGRSALDVWAEIWPIVGPQAEAVLNEGKSSWNEELLLIMERNGFVEESYFTFSYSPVLDDCGQPGGVFCAVTEDTARVLGRRRLKTLRDLGERALTEAKADIQACAAAANALSENLNDFPFALIYLLEPDGRTCRLCETVNYAAGQAASPKKIIIGDETDVWNLSKVGERNQPALIENLTERFGQMPAGPWMDDFAKKALVLPLPKAGVQELPAGFLIAGLSPRLEFNDDYRGFLELAAGHIAKAIANARAYEEERKRAEALAELDRAKTTFFSNISHEFRTPLTLLLGPLEDMVQKPEPEIAQDNRELARVAHRNGLRLLKLVNSLLDFSRIEAGRMQASFEPVDLGKFTGELGSAFRSLVEKAGLRFEVNCPTLPEPVYVDRDLWEKIVFNLLSNAYKFTLSGGINIDLGLEDQMACLKVSDTGTGIPENELPNIFKRFYRLENSGGRTHEGTGIGLALVQELVKLHGGTIEVRSKPEDGSIFTVKIPLGEKHLPGGQVSRTTSQISTALRAEAFINEASRWTIDSAIAGEAPAQEEMLEISPAQNSGSVAPKRNRVLIADDNADMREYVVRLLRTSYEITTASDGASALASAQSTRPDLILADVMMPGLDGFGLLKALRENRDLQSVPVILLSARAGEEARVEGVSRGADDYLTKPFSARELLARVTSHLELARIRREIDQVIRRSEARFRAYLEASSDIMYCMNADWTEMRHLHGRDFIPNTNESSRDWLEKYIHPDDRSHVMDAIQAAIKTKSTFELEHRVIKVDGTLGWTFSRAVPLVDEKSEIVEWFGVATDVTKQKKAQDAFQESEEQYRSLFDSMDEGCCTIEMIFDESQKPSDYVFLDVNPAFETQTGLRDIKGKRGKALFPKINLERIELYGRVALSGEPVRSETYAADLGRWYGTFAFRIGAPERRRVAVIFNDITHRKQLQEELESAVARQTAELRETVEELEAFSYSIAHDMRAPLRAIQGFAKILTHDHGGSLDETGLDYLRRMSHASHRMDRLITDVLNYSKVARGSITIEPVNLKKMLQELVESYPVLQAEGTEIDIADDFPIVRGNEAALTQCFSNLLGNAVKFVAPGCKPKVRVWCESADGRARIYIQDNGIGIEADQHEKIFGMFQRVNKNYEGTGIGLTVVKKAITRMGGKIGLASEPGEGSTFWIELPFDSSVPSSP